MPTAKLPTRLRSETAWVWPTFCIVVGTLGLVGALSAFNARAIPALVLGTALLLYGAIYAWRIGAIATSDGLSVYGVMRVRRFPWDQIDHATRVGWSVVLVMADGSKVKTFGLGPSLIRRRASVDESSEMARTINEIRTQVLAADAG